MKKTVLGLLLNVIALSGMAQVQNLPAPDLLRQTNTVMQALRDRKSVRSYADKALSQQELSDLLWAAQGKNREDGRLTSPTAMNRQEIRVYVFTPSGVSLYDPQQNTLTPCADGDHRDIVASRQDFVKTAPVVLLLVGDWDKYGRTDEHARMMVHCDAGIVSQNISLYCSAAGLATVPRGIMDGAAIKELLGLGENQTPILNHPVGYPVSE